MKKFLFYAASIVARLSVKVSVAFMFVTFGLTWNLADPKGMGRPGEWQFRITLLTTSILIGFIAGYIPRFLSKAFKADLIYGRLVLPPFKMGRYTYRPDMQQPWGASLFRGWCS